MILGEFGIKPVILCVRSFTEFVLGSFGNEAVNKLRYYVLSILLGLLMISYVTIKWIKSDTMC